MLLRQATEELIEQSETILEDVQAEMLADTNYPPPDSSDIPEDRRDAYRKQYQKELKKRISPVRHRIASFAGEAKLCAELYGDLEVEDYFLCNKRPGVPTWAIILTRDAIIQTSAYDFNVEKSSESYGPSIVLHRLQDLDRLSVRHTNQGMIVDANLHKARHNQSQGVFSWRAASENDIETMKRMMGALTKALQR